MTFAKVAGQEVGPDTTMMSNLTGEGAGFMSLPQPGKKGGSN